jgi:lipopolysaccharide transport system permease protein
MSSVPDKYRSLLWWNPISSMVEFFRFIFTGEGTFTLGNLVYSASMSVIILLVGLIIFNRVEKTFMDTV